MGLVNPMHALAQHHFGRQADCSLHLSQCLEFPEKEEAQLCQEGKGILLAVTPSVHCVSEGQWCCKSCVLQLPLPSCEQGTQPGKIVSVPLKSALTWVWLEKMASPFLLEWSLQSTVFSVWTSGYRLRAHFVFSRLAKSIGWLVYGLSHSS